MKKNVLLFFSRAALLTFALVVTGCTAENRGRDQAGSMDDTTQQQGGTTGGSPGTMGSNEGVTQQPNTMASPTPRSQSSGSRTGTGTGGR